MRSSDDGKGFIHLIAFALDDFANWNIDQLEVSPRVDHEVFWFDVPADNEVVMEVLNDHDHTSCIELAVLC